LFFTIDPSRVSNKNPFNPLAFLNKGAILNTWFSNIDNWLSIFLNPIIFSTALKSPCQALAWALYIGYGSKTFQNEETENLDSGQKHAGMTDWEE
jgi:hypothetical protein